MLNTCLINLKPHDCLQCDYEPKSTFIVFVEVVVRLFVWWNNYFWKPNCFQKVKDTSLLLRLLKPQGLDFLGAYSTKQDHPASHITH